MSYKKIDLKIFFIIFYLASLSLISTALAKGYLVGEGDTLKIDYNEKKDEIKITVERKKVAKSNKKA